MKTNPLPGPAHPQASTRQPLALGVVAFVLGVVLAGAWFIAIVPVPKAAAGFPPQPKNCSDNCQRR